MWGRVWNRPQLPACLGATLMALIPLVGIFLTEARWVWPVAAFLYGSGIFLALSPWAGRKFLVALYALLVLPFLVFESAYFVSYYLQGSGFNRAFFYHLNPDVIYAGIGEYYWLIILLLLIFVLLLLSFLMFNRAERKTAQKTFFIGLGLFVLGLAVSPSVGSLVSYFQFMPESADSDPYALFSELSNSKVRAQFKGTEKKNIVFIYLESIEQRYFDEDVFPGLLPELTKLRQESLVFPNVYQGVGAEYTMGGIVASQCGYPLAARHHIAEDSFGMYDDFLPRAICLGDLLQADGYQSVYMGGADTRFAGKQNFLQSHGYAEIIGKMDILSTLGGRIPVNAWGVYDDTLFVLGFEKYLSLSAQTKPFFLTILTLDTHHPAGHSSPSCGGYGVGDNSMLNAAHCTDVLVGRFIRKIRSSPFSDNTIIVLFSDHLAHPNTASSLLKQSTRPANLTFMVNFPDGRHEEIVHPGTHYAVAPTLLDVMGYELDGQMGFGTPLTKGPGYLIRKFGEDGWQEHESSLMEIAASLWTNEVSLKGKELSLSVKNLNLSIGDQVFNLRSAGFSNIPESAVFIFDSRTLRLKDIHSFTFNRGMDNLTLSRILLENRDDLVFAISYSMDLPGFCDYTQVHPLDYCFFFGKPGSADYLWAPIRGDFSISADQIESLRRADMNAQLQLEKEMFLRELAEPRVYEGIVPPAYIAHAGGGFDKMSYTNSLEALNQNFELGHRFFEVDFSWTSDGELVAIHDWDESLEELFYAPGSMGVPTKEGFLKLKSRKKLTQLTLEDVLEWAKRKGDVYIVTDVKDQNVVALEKIRREHPDALQYVIPQVYDYAEYMKVEEMGYRDIILTLYKIKVNLKDLVDFVSVKTPFAVTMHWSLAQEGLAQMIKPWKIFVYAHTVNDAAKFVELSDLGVNGIYTDFLTPADVGGPR